MKTRAGYFRLGLFIVGAIGAGILALLILGVGNMFRPSVIMETYFDGSVQGLDVGAPVKLRGVTIGEVSRIGFTHGRYEQDVPVVKRRQYVMVEAVIRPNRLGASGRLPTPEMVESMVGRGLRVRMTPQGVTGIYFLELDFMDPAQQSPIPIDWDPENIYVPSAPGAVTQFIEYADRIGRRLDTLDVEGLVESMQGALNKVNGLLDTLNSTVGGLEVERISAETLGLLTGFQATIRRLDTLLESPALKGMPEDLGAAAANLRALSESPRFDESMDTLDRAMESIERTARGIEGTVQGYEHDMVLILDNLRVMSDQLRALSEDASMYPGIFFGRPPATHGDTER